MISLFSLLEDQKVAVDVLGNGMSLLRLLENHRETIKVSTEVPGSHSLSWLVIRVSPDHVRCLEQLPLSLLAKNNEVESLYHELYSLH